MLILPPGHQQATQAPRTLRPRERWMLGGVGGLVVVLAVVLVISLAAGGGRTARGCVTVGLAYSTGGDKVTRCGGSARALCAGVGHAGGITGAPAAVVARECRRAGLPVG